MKCVYISFLGKETPTKGSYCFEGENEKYEGLFGQIPVVKKLLGEGGVDDICVLAEKNGIDDESNPAMANYRALLEGLDELDPSVGRRSHVVSQVMDETGMDLYASLVECMARHQNEEEIALYIDTAGCPASASICLFSALDMIEKNAGNVKAKAIYSYRTLGDSTDEGIESHVICNMARKYNEYRLAQAVASFRKTMHIAVGSVAEEETDTAEVKSLKTALGSLAASLQYANLPEIVVFSRRLVNAVKLVVADPETSTVLRTSLKSLGEMLGSYLVEDDIYSAMNIAKGIYFDARQTQTAVTLLEAVYNQIIDKLIETNLQEEDKIIFDGLTSNQRVKIHKYAEVALCIRYNSSAEEVSREYKKLMQFTSEEVARLYQTIGDSLETIYKNTTPALCYKKVYDRKLKAGRAISDFLSELRNSMDHGIGRKTENEADLILAYFDVLKLMYRTFVLA